MPPKNKKHEEELCVELYNCGLDSSGSSSSSGGSASYCTRSKDKKKHDVPCYDIRSSSESDTSSSSTSSETESEDNSNNGDGGSTSFDDSTASSSTNSSSSDSIAPPPDSDSESDTSSSNSTTSTSSSSGSDSSSDAHYQGGSRARKARNGRRFSATFCVRSASSGDEIALPCISPSGKTTWKKISNKARATSGVGSVQSSTAVRK